MLLGGDGDMHYSRWFILKQISSRIALGKDLVSLPNIFFFLSPCRQDTIEIEAQEYC